MPIAADRPLLLASASPRRRELLERVGIHLQVMRFEVDETVPEGESPDAYLARVVTAKWTAAQSWLGAEAGRSAAYAACLVADTVVTLNERILVKPESEEEAQQMVTALAGREHVVKTRFAIGAPGATSPAAETVATTVWFRELSPEEVARYVATGEGLDKAGAYGIQGVGAMLVTRVVGSYTNVVGLPLCEVVQALQNRGLLGVCPP